MYGTLAGALSGRKIPFDRSQYTASVAGRIVGVGKTIRIESIAVHYDLVVPPGTLDVTTQALEEHARGSPAHESVKDAIAINWEATPHLDDHVVTRASNAP